MIVAGAAAGYAAAHLRDGAIFTWGGLLTIGVVVAAGGVGFIDDFIKVRHQRSLGLTAVHEDDRPAHGRGHVRGASPSDSPTCTPRCRSHGYDSIGIDLGNVGWVVLAVAMVVATTNGVNLADGLDGLAAGSAAFCFSAFVVIGFWQFRHVDVYQVPQALDLALIAAAMMGACTGFLWWNAAPARIIMGDTGALAIGAGLAALALVMNTQLLLPGRRARCTSSRRCRSSSR